MIEEGPDAVGDFVGGVRRALDGATW